MADLENARSQVIEELEQVIEKDKQERSSSVEEEDDASLMLTEKDDTVRVPMTLGEGYVDEEGIRNRSTSCAQFKSCVKTTYDVLRSVPMLTFIWAGGAIYASNMAVRNVEQVASTMQVFNYFNQIFRVMDWGLAYVDFVNSFVAVLAILFSGATLELFVGRFCKFDGCYKCFSRFSFRSIQGLFFPAAYVGFLATFSLMVMSIVLAFAVVLTNMACNLATSDTGATKAAGYLSEQINVITHWLSIKTVTVSGHDLSNYCAASAMNTTWFWRTTFIYVAAAAFCQVNLAFTMYSLYLTTGFEIRKNDIVRKHSTVIEKYAEEKKRPVSVKSDASIRSGNDRPFSGRYESKENNEV